MGKAKELFGRGVIGHPLLFGELRRFDQHGGFKLFQAAPHVEKRNPYPRMTQRLPFDRLGMGSGLLPLSGGREAPQESPVIFKAGFAIGNALKRLGGCRLGYSTPPAATVALVSRAGTPSPG